MDYEIKLKTFSGPLDLLLELISRARIEIKDIFVSEITEQYIEYLSEASDIDMDSASDFVKMAATLLYIKSRALLPACQPEYDEDGFTPEERLFKKLALYKSIKDVCETLRLFEAKGALRYFGLPLELSDAPIEEIYVNSDPRLLRLYFTRLNRPAEEKPAYTGVTVIRDAYSVREQIRLIMARLAIKPTMSFTELLSAAPSREEIAATFMSLLELIGKNRVKVSQERLFADIYITRADEPEENGGSDADR